MIKEEILRSSNDFLCEEAKNSLRVGQMLTLLVCVLESVMIVYTAVVFDFHTPVQRCYLAAYLFLFLLSASGFAVCRLWRHSVVRYARAFHALTLSFGTLMVLCAGFVSVLDMRTGASPIVFLTLITGFAGGFSLYPKESVPLFCGLFAAFYLSVRLGLRRPFDFAFLLNLLIFLVVVLAVSLIKYRSRIKEYSYRAQLEQNALELAAAVQSLGEVNERLEVESETDRLTGVKNRWALHEEFDEELARCMEKQLPVSVMMIDLDRFKRINDTFGHRFGDECLVGVATVLRELAGGGGVYRFGGEEFVLTFPAVDQAEGYDLAEEIRARVEESRFMGEFPVTVSIGLYSAVPDENNCGDCFWTRADRALYRAKRAGRNRVEVYDPAWDTEESEEDA